MKLLHDWILVELEKPREKSKGGIILAGPEPIRTAKVIAVGPGRRLPNGTRVPMGIEPGDRFPFFVAVAETGSNKAAAKSLPEDQALVRERDVLFLMDEDLEVTL